MGKINTNNYPNRPVSVYQDDDMFILQDNGGETYTTNVGDIKTLIDNKISSSGKADKVSSATAGHLAGLDANGNLTDSGISVSNGTIRATELVTSDGVQANDISYFNEIDMDGSSISGVSTLNVNQIDVHDGQAVEFLTDVVVNGAVADEDGNVLSNKTDKVENATSGHLAGLDSNGNLTDSGVSPTEDVTVEGNPVSFDSPFEQDAKSVVVSVKPIQDLHGYDHPWPAGGGKNKLPLVLADIKANNTDGTWNGNTYTWNGATFVVNTDDAGNVLSINGTGNGSAGVTLSLFFNLKAGTYIMNSGFIEAQGSNDTLLLVNDVVIARGNPGSPGQTFTLEEDSACHWVFRIATSTTLTCKPMIRLATESDATFEPYSNICPIEGADEVEIEVSDGEGTPTTTTIPLPSTLYDADVDVTNGDADSRYAIATVLSTDDIGLQENSGEKRFVVVNKCVGAIGNQANDICSVIPENYDDPNEIYRHDNCFICYLNGNIYFKLDSTSTTVDAVKAKLRAMEDAGNPLQFCYELATPTTISFDPTDVELLEGTNVVSTNGEKVAVTYGRSLWQDIDDLKTDTEGKLDKSDVATIEGDTASKAYSVNDFMLRADGLYKVTQPIAQNASITASNTTKTTIGAVLTALLNS